MENEYVPVGGMKAMRQQKGGSCEWASLASGGPPYRLYGKRSTVSAVPQMLLEEIGVAFERIWVGDDGISPADYRAINPMARVPTLVFPSGIAIFETAAILTLLSLAHPDCELSPHAGTEDAARLAQWLVFLSSSLYETSRRGYRSAEMSIDGAAVGPGIRAKALDDQRVLLKALDSVVSPYLLGHRITAADLYLYQLMQWYLGPSDEVRALFPALADHSSRVRARPAVARVIRDHVS